MESKEVKKDVEFKPQPKKFTTFGNDDEEETSFELGDVNELLNQMESEIKSDNAKVNARAMNSLMAAKFTTTEKMEKGKVTKSCNCMGESGSGSSNPFE